MCGGEMLANMLRHCKLITQYNTKTDNWADGKANEWNYKK